MKIFIFTSILVFTTNVGSSVGQSICKQGLGGQQHESAGYATNDQSLCLQTCALYQNSSTPTYFSAFVTDELFEFCFCTREEDPESPSACLGGETMKTVYQSTTDAVVITNMDSMQADPSIITNKKATITPKFTNAPATSDQVVPEDLSPYIVNPSSVILSSQGAVNVSFTPKVSGDIFVPVNYSNVYVGQVSITAVFRTEKAISGLGFTEMLVADRLDMFFVMTQGTNASIDLQYKHIAGLLTYRADAVQSLYKVGDSHTQNVDLSQGLLVGHLKTGHLSQITFNVGMIGVVEIIILEVICPAGKEFCPLSETCAEYCFHYSLTGSAPNQLVLNGVFDAKIKSVILMDVSVTGAITHIFDVNNNEISSPSLLWIRTGQSAQLGCSISSPLNTHPFTGGVPELEDVVTVEMSKKETRCSIVYEVAHPFSTVIKKNADDPVELTYKAANPWTVPDVSGVRTFERQVAVTGLKFVDGRPYDMAVEGYRLHSWVNIAVTIDEGAGVHFLFDIPKLGSRKNMTADNTAAVDFYITEVGEYTAFVSAANGLNLLWINRTFVVLEAIAGVKIQALPQVFSGEPTSFTVQIFNGTEITMMTLFGDGTNKTEVKPEAPAGQFFIPYTYNQCGDFTLKVLLKNMISEGDTWQKFDPDLYTDNVPIKVFCRMSAIHLITTPAISIAGDVVFSKNTDELELDIMQDTGSHITYIVNWGDGTDSTEDQSTLTKPLRFQKSHKYTNTGVFTVNVTATNSEETVVSKQIKVNVKDCSVPSASFSYGTVDKPTMLLRGVDNTLVATIETVDCGIQGKIQWLKNGTLEIEVAYDPNKNDYKLVIPKDSLELNTSNNFTLKLDFEDVMLYTGIFRAINSPLFVEIDNGGFREVAYRTKVPGTNMTAHQNLTMSAEAYDPDLRNQGAKGISFVWTCKLISSYSVAMDALTEYLKHSTNLTHNSTLCLTKDYAEVSREKSFIINTQQMLQQVQYKFRVVGKKGERETSFEQELRLLAGDPPQPDFHCVSNCDTKLNFLERTVFRFDCPTCGDEPIVGKWLVTTDDSNGELADELRAGNATSTGFNRVNLVINEGILKEDKKYTFILISHYPGQADQNSTFKISKQTCGRPSPGSCKISPHEGYAVDTPFSLVCQDWSDTDLILTYHFSYDNGDEPRLVQGEPVYPTLNTEISQPSLLKFRLGLGDKKNDYVVKIHIKVAGRYKAYTQYRPLLIKVFPLQAGHTSSEDELLDNTDPSDYHKVAIIAQAISVVANDKSETTEQIPATETDPLTGIEVSAEQSIDQKSKDYIALQQKRTKVIDMLMQAPVAGIQAFQILGDALAASTVEPGELVPSTQEDAADMIEKMSEVLTPDNLVDIGPAQLEDMSQSYLACISNIVSASNNAMKLSTSNGTDGEGSMGYGPTTGILVTTQQVTRVLDENAQAQLSKTTITKVLGSLDKLINVIATLKVPGENVTELQTEQFKIRLKVSYASDMNGMMLGAQSDTGEDQGGFLLPDLAQDLGLGPNIQVELSNIVMQKETPFTWDLKKSKFISTETQSLKIKRSANDTLQVHNLSVPIRVAIRNNPEKFGSEKISLTMPEDLRVLTFKAESENCNMLMKLSAKNDPDYRTTLIVYLQYGKVPTEADHDLMVTLSPFNGTQTHCNANKTQCYTTHGNMSHIVKVVTSDQPVNSTDGVRRQDHIVLSDGTLILWNFTESTYGNYSNKSDLYVATRYSGPMPPKRIVENDFNMDKIEYAGTFDYEVKAFCSECNYFSEAHEKWRSDGCQLNLNITNYQMTHCKCTHLTAFGGFYVAPNPIPTPSWALLKEGYVLLIVVASALLLWIVGLVIMRRFDNCDVTKVGVCPLLDNRPEDTYMYEVTVNTGTRRHAGTQSNIFFTVAGQLSDSGVRRLRDTERECFQKASSDVFIMTTDAHLGDLNYIRLWHDNSGGGWYIRSLEVIDLQTEEKFLFIANKWLAVDRGDCVVDCIFPVSGSEELSDFNYLFATRSRRDMADNHIWFSIYARPPRSAFTRCQRLSVAVCLLMTAMTASTMFYGQVPPGNAETENRIAGFTFTWQMVYVAVISACITVPVNLLLVGLFRSIRPVYKMQEPTSGSETSLNGHHDDEEHRTDSPENLIQQDTKKESLRKKTSTHVTLPQPERANEMGEKKKVGKPFFLPHWFLYVAWFLCIATTLGCGCIVVLYGMAFGNTKSLEWLGSVTLALIQDVLIMQPMKIFLMALVVAVIVKNIDDEEKSVVEIQSKSLAYDEKWLHKAKNENTIFDRIDMDIEPPDASQLNSMREVRLQQQKMYAISRELLLYVCFALLVFFIGYMTRERMSYFQNRDVEELFNLKPRQSAAIKPTATVAKKKKAAGKNKQEKVQAPPDGVPEPNIYFNKVQSWDDFWPWMDNFFLKQAYPEPWYDDILDPRWKDTDKWGFPGKIFLNDLTSKIINGIRIRQVRVKPESCMVDELIAPMLTLDCMAGYSMANEETRDFKRNWGLPIKYNSSSMKTLDKPWRYQNWQELDAYPYPAILETYFGGGYVVEIFPKWKNHIILNKLKESMWIDRQTRAILIEFALFNGQTNHFNMVTIVFELPPSGGIVHYFSVSTFKMYTSTRGTELAMLGSQALFLLVMLIFTIREVRMLYREGWAYFKEFWNLVEVALILLSALAIVFYVYRGVLARKLLQRLPDKAPDKFINFQFASYWDLMYTYIVSIIVFFVTIKFIKLLRFNRRMSMLSSTLKAAWYPLSMFGIIFSIILGAVVISCNIVFGMLLDGYQSKFKTVASIISLLLGKFSYHQFENTNPVLGPVFFFGFNIMVNWIIMNMFISILNDVFADVRLNIEMQNNDYEMVDFFMAHLKGWLGMDRNTNDLVDKQLERNESRASRKSPTRSRASRMSRHSAGGVRFKHLSQHKYDWLSDEEEGEEALKGMKASWLDEKFSSYDHLLKEEEKVTPDMEETLDKFINCMNLLYFDDVTVAGKMNKVVKDEIKNKKGL